MTPLRAFGSVLGSARGINNRGQIVGSYLAPDGAGHGYLWQRGRVTDLGAIFPVDLNDRGQVLGTSRTATGELHAVIWENGRTIDLSTHGVLVETIPRQKLPGDVVGINNHGHLVANLGQPNHWPGPGVLFR